jgi:hypothetical protein
VGDLSSLGRPAAVADADSRSILILRGQRVILDSDLALIYGVSTGGRSVEGRFPLLYSHANLV